MIKILKINYLHQLFSSNTLYIPTHHNKLYIFKISTYKQKILTKKTEIHKKINIFINMTKNNII